MGVTMRRANASFRRTELRRSRSVRLIALLLVCAGPRAYGQQNNWLNGVDGFWDIGANWSLGLPQAVHDVRINFPSIRTTHRSGATTIKTIDSKGILTLTGGTLTISNGGSIDNALEVSAGTLAGSMLVSASGLTTWTGGTIAGSGTLRADGGLAISGSNFKFLSRSLINANANSYLADKPLWSNSGAVLNNIVGGVLDVRGLAGFSVNGAVGSIINAGVINKTLSGISLWEWSLTNSGTLNVQQGNVRLTGGGSSTGTLTTATGSSLEFAGGTYSISNSVTGTGTIDVQDGTVVFGGGTYRANKFSFTGGTTYFNGAAVIDTSNAPQIEVNGGNLVFTTTTAPNLNTLAFNAGSVAGGAINIVGPWSWGAGEFGAGGKLTTTGAMSESASGEKYLNRQWENQGTATFDKGSQLFAADSARLDNAIGATLNLGGGTRLEKFTFKGELNNFGSLNKNGAADTTINWSLTNTGFINVNQGRLYIKGDANNIGGMVTLASGTFLDLNAGVTTFSGDVSGAGQFFPHGPGVVDYASGILAVGNLNVGGLFNYNSEKPGSATSMTLNANMGGTGDLTVGSLSWNSGTLSGTGDLTVTGAFTATSNSARTLGKHLILQSGGTIGGAGLDAAAGANLETNGTLFFDDIQSLNNSQGQGKLTINGAVEFKKKRPATFDLRWDVLNDGSFINRFDATGGGNRISLQGNSVFNGSYTGEAGTTLVLPSGYTTDFNSSILGTGTVEMTGGTVNFNGVSVNASQLTFTNGLLGGNGDATINAPMLWQGGLMTGKGTVITNGLLTMNLASSKTLARTLEVGAGATLIGASMRSNSGAVLTNKAASTFSILDDSGFTVGAGTGQIHNLGTLQKTGGTGTSTINWSLINDGILDVATGTVSLERNGVHGGLFKAQTGTTLRFNAGTHTLNGNVDADGTFLVQNLGVVTVKSPLFKAKNVQVTGGNLIFAQGVVIDPANTEILSTSGTTSFISGAAQGVKKLTLQSTGIVDGSDVTTFTDVVWRTSKMLGDGTSIIGSTLSMETTADKTLGRTLQNNALSQLKDGALRSEAIALISNSLGADFEVWGDSDIRLATGIGTIQNFGDFRKNNSSAAQVTTVDWAFDNDASGLVDVEGGILEFTGQFLNYNNGTGTLSDGSYEVSNGAKLRFTNANLINNAASITLDGLGSAIHNTVGQNALRNMTSNSGSLSMLNGPGGTPGYTFPSMSNSGSMLFSGSNMTVTGSFSNSGTMDVEQGSEITFSSSASNSGSMSMIGSSATGTTFSVGNSGTMSLSSSDMEMVGDISNSGTMDVGGSGPSTMTSDGQFSSLMGSTSIAEGSTLAAEGGIAISGGTVGGLGVLDGDIAQTGGIIAPGYGGTAGMLDVVGSLTQGASSQLTIDILSRPALLQFDQLFGTGTATLNGTLRLQIGTGTLLVGDEFEILRFGSRTGTFSSLVTNMTNQTWQVTYTSTSAFVKLIAAGGSKFSGGSVNNTTGTYGGPTGGSGGNGVVPEPSTWVAITIGSAWMARRRRRN